MGDEAAPPGTAYAAAAFRDEGAGRKQRCAIIYGKRPDDGDAGAAAARPARGEARGRPAGRFGMPPVCRSCGRPGHVEKDCFGLRRQIAVERSLFSRERARLQNAQERLSAAAPPPPPPRERDREREGDAQPAGRALRVVMKKRAARAAGASDDARESGAGRPPDALQMLGASYGDDDSDGECGAA